MDGSSRGRGKDEETSQEVIFKYYFLNLRSLHDVN